MSSEISRVAFSMINSSRVLRDLPRKVHLLGASPANVRSQAAIYLYCSSYSVVFIRMTSEWVPHEGQRVQEIARRVRQRSSSDTAMRMGPSDNLLSSTASGFSGTMPYFRLEWQVPDFLLGSTWPSGRSRISARIMAARRTEAMTIRVVIVSPN